MKIAVASDEKTALTDFVVEELQQRGHEVQLFGPLKGEALPWTLASEKLADAVARGRSPGRSPVLLYRYWSLDGSQQSTRYSSGSL